MVGWIGLTMVGLLALGLGLWVTLVVSMRTKYQPLLTAIRRLNRRFTNPRVLRTAGRPGAAASVIRHVGRSTGAPYETPVGVVETAEGLLIALPYGTSPDWVKNVRAAGAAVVQTEGETLQVTDPQVVRAADIDQYLSGKDRRVGRLYGVEQFLSLKRVGADVSSRADR